MEADLSANDKALQKAKADLAKAKAKAKALNSPFEGPKFPGDDGKGFRFGQAKQAVDSKVKSKFSTQSSKSAFDTFAGFSSKDNKEAGKKKRSEKMVRSLANIEDSSEKTSTYVRGIKLTHPPNL